MTSKDLFQSILQQAIQGKLVNQIASEESICDLISLIKKEKEKLIKDKVIKEGKYDKSLNKKDLPKGWSLVKIGDISRIVTKQTGFDYSNTIKPNLLEYKIESSIPMVQTKNFKGKVFNFDTDYYLPIKIANQFPNILLNNKCLLLSIVGASIGNIGLFEPTILGIIGGAICKVELMDDRLYEYIYYFLQSPEGQKEIYKNYKSSAQGTITVQDVREIEIPLPPLSEQHRIVAKLEALQPLCETYGEAYNELENLNKELPDLLKSSFLHQAICGKLVSQNPDEGSANDLIAEIENEKKRQIDEYNKNNPNKKQKKYIAPLPIPEEDKPFDIPSSWEWVRLGEVGIFCKGHGIKRDETCEVGLPCVRYGEMYTTYKKSFIKAKSHTFENIFQLSTKAKKNDILMALTGENKVDIALAVTYQGIEDIAIGGDLCKYTPFFINSLFLVYVINSYYGINYKQEVAKGDIIIHISTDKLSSLLIPLPPLSEQRRIVEKLEELFVEIDKLK